MTRRGILQAIISGVGMAFVPFVREKTPPKLPSDLCMGFQCAGCGSTNIVTTSSGGARGHWITYDEGGNELDRGTIPPNFTKPA